MITQETVAVYSVGYKIGMILQMGLVWPFQLAWPAVAYSISKRAGHEKTYARVLTYLTFGLVLGVLGLSLLSRAGLDEFAGQSYTRAYEVVPLVALAYAFAGVQFCLSPGIHIAGKTKYLPLFSAVGTVINLGLNFLLVPDYGMLGATWATVASYFFLAAATCILSQRCHPVEWEYGRLGKIVGVGAVVYTIGVFTDLGESLLAGLTWQFFLATGAYPALLLATGFLHPGERRMVANLFNRLAPWRVSDRPPLDGDLGPPGDDGPL
ncbi:MAG: polysaccharide biosynthesis C-terminal domain-containing protein [Acidobacteriota bacterium]